MSTGRLTPGGCRSGAVRSALGVLPSWTVPLRAFCLVAVAALFGCLSRPAYDARGFSCSTDADCDGTTTCFYAVCRAHVLDAGFPHSSTTGIPTGTVLHADSGTLQLKVDGGLVDGLDLTGCIDVFANGVTIQRSRIRCGGDRAIAIHDGVVGTVIRDVELDGLGAAQSEGVTGEHLLAQRLDIHDVDTALNVGNDVALEDSFLHGSGGKAVYGNGNVGMKILHNRIETSGGGNCIFLGTYFGPVADVLIQGNLLSGGGWVVQVEGDGGSSIRVLENRFGSNFDYGPFALVDGAIESGNVWDDGGINVDGVP